MSEIEKIDTDKLKRYWAQWPKPTKVHPVRDAFRTRASAHIP